MAEYTMYFKDAIQLMGGEIITTDKGTILSKAYHVGLSAYPIFHPTYRERLNGMIVDRYMNREIGAETVSEFRRMLRSRMNEIMPTYNRMYEADRIKFDPLRTYDMRTLMSGEVDGTVIGSVTSDATGSDSDTTTGQSSTTGESATQSTTKSRGVTSDFPQTQLKGDEDYATAAADQVGESSGSGDSSESAQSEQSRDSESQSHSETAQNTTSRDETKTESHTYGFQGSPAELVMQFRESVMNTDMLVLDELEDCFMQIFGTDDIDTAKYPWYTRRYPKF